MISAAEADYERNLANTIDLIYLLANDDELWRATTARCSRAGCRSTARSPTRRPTGLQPLWSKPHSKPVSFQDARAKSR